MTVFENATPRPWVVEHHDGGTCIAEKTTRARAAIIARPVGGQHIARQATANANARLIVAAVNTFDDLREALPAHDEFMLALGFSGPDDPDLTLMAAENWRCIRAALQRANEAMEAMEWGLAMPFDFARRDDDPDLPRKPIQPDRLAASGAIYALPPIRGPRWDDWALLAITAAGWLIIAGLVIAALVALP